MLDKIKAQEALISMYKEYVRLLGDELNELTPLAHVHGWKSHRAEDGQLLRTKIQNAESTLFKTKK